MLDWWQYGLLMLCGMAAGFVDSIAGGGGLITVPALLWAGLPGPMALGTNKMQSWTGTALAVWAYARAGLVRWREIWLGILITSAAAAWGAHTVARLDPSFLRRIIPWLLLSIAAYTALSPQLGRISGRAHLPLIAFSIIGGLVLGFYDGFFGPGAGAFWTMACVLFMGMEMRRATAFTKVMNLTSNLASLTIFIIGGFVQTDVAACMIAGQLIGASSGSRLVIRDGTSIVRPVMLITVVLLAGKLIWDQY